MQDIQDTIVYKLLANDSTEDICEIAANCFNDDSYYISVFPKASKRRNQIKELFKQSFEICLKFGHIFIIKKDNKPVSFCSLVDYNRLKTYSSDDFNKIFPNLKKRDTNKCSLAKNTLGVKELTKDILIDMYIIAIAVEPEYRGKGLATKMIQNICGYFPDYNILTDISNKKSLPIYSKCGFELIDSTEEYYFVKKSIITCESQIDNNNINLLLPTDTATLLFPETRKDLIKYPYLKSNNNGGLIANYVYTNNSYNLRENEKESIFASVHITYDELLEYQRYIGLINYEECGIEIYGQRCVGYITHNHNLQCVENFRTLVYQDIDVISDIEKGIIADVIICIRSHIAHPQFHP